MLTAVVMRPATTNASVQNLLASDISTWDAARQTRGAGIYGLWIASASSLPKMAPAIFLVLRRQKRRLT